MAVFECSPLPTSSNRAASISTNSSRDSVGLCRCTQCTRCGCRSIAVRITVVLPEPASPMQERDALAAGDPVLEIAQRLPMRLRQHQEPRVRRQIERPLAEAEKLFVHRILSARTCRSSTARQPTTVLPRPTPR